MTPRPTIQLPFNNWWQSQKRAGRWATSRQANQPQSITCLFTLGSGLYQVSSTDLFWIWCYSTIHCFLSSPSGVVKIPVTFGVAKTLPQFESSAHYQNVGVCAFFVPGTCCHFYFLSSVYSESSCGTEKPKQCRAGCFPMEAAISRSACQTVWVKRWRNSVTYVRHCLCSAGIRTSLHCRSVQIPLNPTRLYVIPDELWGWSSMIRVASPSRICVEFGVHHKKTQLNPIHNWILPPHLREVFCFVLFSRRLLCLKFGTVFPVGLLSVMFVKMSQIRHHIWFCLKLLWMSVILLRPIVFSHNPKACLLQVNYSDRSSLLDFKRFSTNQRGQIWEV